MRNINFRSVSQKGLFYLPKMKIYKAITLRKNPKIFKILQTAQKEMLFFSLMIYKITILPLVNLDVNGLTQKER